MLPRDKLSRDMLKRDTLSRDMLPRDTLSRVQLRLYFDAQSVLPGMWALLPNCGL